MVRFNVPSAPLTVSRTTTRPPVRSMLAAGEYSSHIRLDRPDRTPLLRFSSLQRLLTALRCPVLPTSGRSRFGVCADVLRALARKCFREVRQTRISSPLRSSASPTANGLLHRRLTRGPASHASLFLFTSDVPLPAFLGPLHAAPPELFTSRQRSWGSALRSFDPAGMASMTFPSLLAHLPFPESSAPTIFCRGIDGTNLIRRRS